MKFETSVILKTVAALLWAFMAGLVASSFYIGDRNLLVTLVALLLIAGVLVVGRHLCRMRRWWSIGALCISFVLGFVCSVFGIC